MRKLCLGLLFLAYAFGQDSLTIMASRSITPQPDQVVFAVYVTSTVNIDLDGVVAALAGSGITAGNLSSVYGYMTSTGTGNNVQYQQTLNWVFTLNVPFAKLKDTVGTLTALQQTIGQNNSGLTLSYSGQGTATSPQLQASRSCPIPDLIADARAQAQTLANAAGAVVGPILALSDASSAGSLGAVVTYIPAARVVNALFTLSQVYTTVSNPVTCAIVVKFSLLRPQ